MKAPVIFTPEYYACMRDLESKGWWNAAMRDVMAMMLARAGLPASGWMLDVGCGSGQTMLWFLSEHAGWRAIGLDIAPEGLDAARAFGLTTLTRATVLQLPYPDRCADLVVTLDVLQHLPLGGDVAALGEMRRVLKPGGHLFIRTNAQAFPRTADDPAFNFHRYTPAELRAKLVAAGLAVLRLGRLNALLGLGEIPRELRARMDDGPGYHGTLARAKPGNTAVGAVKQAWLRLEGHAVRAGVQLPLGRTIIALGRA